MHFRLFSVLAIYGDSRPTRKCAAFSSLAWLVYWATAVQRGNAQHFRVWHGLYIGRQPSNEEMHSIFESGMACLLGDSPP